MADCCLTREVNNCTGTPVLLPVQFKAFTQGRPYDFACRIIDKIGL